jgi:hypothetical protein
LPDLKRMKVNLYVADPVHSPTVNELAAMIRRAYAARGGRVSVAAG